MNKLITAICLLIVLSFTVFAQDDNTEEEYNKNEYYVGYTNQQTGNFQRSSFHGIEAAYTRNVHRWFGIRADFSYAKNDRTFFFGLPDPAGGTASFRQDNFRSVTQFLGGIQIKDNASKKRFKPFAFALGGVAVNKNTFKNLTCTSQVCATVLPFGLINGTFRDTGLAGAFGGGLDIKINDRIDFRAIQADYNPIYSNTRVDNNFRFGVGFVFK